jgi:hypothetical protein
MREKSLSGAGAGARASRNPEGVQENSQQLTMEREKIESL